MEGFLEGLTAFAAILAVIYGVTVALYFALGYGIIWLNNRNPERRIQKNRRGEKRKAIEIRLSMASIFVTCLSVTIGVFVQYMGWTILPWSFNWWAAVPLFLLC